MANNQLLASDNFASGSLAPSWVTVSGYSRSIVTGSPFVSEPGSLNTTYGQQWSGFASPDQTSEFTINLTNETNNYCILFVRMPSSGVGGYQLNIGNNGGGAYIALYVLGGAQKATGICLF